MSNLATLYYVYDPMCSWCWAYRPVMDQLEPALKNQVKIIYVLGGLAEDTDEPMPKAMQQKIKGHWQHIEKTVGTSFNYNFWTENTPIRATYPACRAVIAARKQNQSKAMILAIQRAYYLRAMNPSEDDILLQLADELNLDFDVFMKDLASDEVAAQLQQEINFARAIGADSFPSLKLKLGNSFHNITIDYHNAHSTLAAISEFRSAAM